MSCLSSNRFLTGRKTERVLSYSYLNNTINLTTNSAESVLRITNDYSRKLSIITNHFEIKSWKHRKGFKDDSNLTITDEAEESTIGPYSIKNLNFNTNTFKSLRTIKEKIAFPDFMNDFSYQSNSKIRTSIDNFANTNTNIELGVKVKINVETNADSKQCKNDATEALGDNKDSLFYMIRDCLFPLNTFSSLDSLL